MERSEIKEVLECLKIQLKKLEVALDLMDKQFYEIQVATDAIRFDFEELKRRVNQ